MGFAAEQLQMLAERLLDFTVARQGTPRGHAESLGRLQLGNAKVLNSLLDDNACSFLGQHLTRTIIAVDFFAHAGLPTSDAARNDEYHLDGVLEQ